MNGFGHGFYESTLLRVSLPRFHGTLQVFLPPAYRDGVLAQLPVRQLALGRSEDLSPVVPLGLSCGELGNGDIQKNVHGGAAFAVVGGRGERLECNEVPGPVEQATLKALADRDVLWRTVRLRTARSLAACHL